VTRLIDINHAEMVQRLAKPGQDIIAELTPNNAHLWHMASCVMGEAGELFDAIKKPAIYAKGAIDRENVVEELGDLEFYLAGLRLSLGITRAETLQANMDKLQKRYHKGTYSNEQAQERADKAEQV
jgi:NTP pyrophosphatase (non-canonical NTP hydrolase)